MASNSPERQYWRYALCVQNCCTNFVSRKGYRAPTAGGLRGELKIFLQVHRADQALLPARVDSFVGRSLHCALRPPASFFLTCSVFSFSFGFVVVRPEATSSTQPSSGIYGRLTRYKPWKRVLTHTHTLCRNRSGKHCYNTFKSADLPPFLLRLFSVKV